jgi:hypothetical protein
MEVPLVLEAISRMYGSDDHSINLLRPNLMSMGVSARASTLLNALQSDSDLFRVSVGLGGLLGFHPMFIDPIGNGRLGHTQPHRELILTHP